MKKRLFIGIPVPDDLGIELVAYQKRYRQYDFMRVIPKRKFHLTLCFLGLVEEELVENLMATVQITAFKHQSFDLVFNRISLAPNNRDARMIWAKYYSNPSFSDLAHSFNKLYDILSIDNKFHSQPIPHITLMRFPPKSEVVLKGNLGGNVGIHVIKVSEIVLWESILMEGGYTYRPLIRVKLR